MQSTVSFATILHKRSTSITHARANYYIRQGVWATHGPNAPKSRYLGTISAKLLMQLDENLPPERLNTPPLDAIRVQREAQALHTPGHIITYARSNYYIRQVELLHTLGCEDNHGPNAPKSRYLGTISAKLLMQLDENLPPERLNTPPLDAIRVRREAQALHTPGHIITYARSNYYMRQVELLHTLGCEDNHG